MAAQGSLPYLEAKKDSKKDAKSYKSFIQQIFIDCLLGSTAVQGIGNIQW